MESFEGRLAVVTGGGAGMGRELVIQLAAAGCSVAMCDLDSEAMEETSARARAAVSGEVRISAHLCDVCDETAVVAFRDEVVAQHETDHVNLVFNNAGITGGGSFLMASRGEWDRTFGVCWGGVYHCTRAFLPLLVASDDGYLVNTSSVNGFWASLGPGRPHTAYSAAKFAVKGFTEALMEDLRLNAPHVRAAVVMPGHVGTDMVRNTRRVHDRAEPGAFYTDRAREIRSTITHRGTPADGMTDEQLLEMMDAMADASRDSAPTTAEQAATIILDGVRAGRWRILVGDDARQLDEAVRADPEAAYGPDGFTLSTVR